MAKEVEFQGQVHATSTAESFHGTGTLDIVSYARAPSSLTLGDYDLGVIVSLEEPLLNSSWAAGDRFFGVERLVGSQHSDFLFGNSQSNYLDGGGSPDFLFGLVGNDSLRGGGGFDFLFGGDGNDLMLGQSHTDTLNGDGGDDRMWGGSNFVTRTYPGTNYADQLYGGGGEDQMQGDVPRPARGTRTEEY